MIRQPPKLDGAPKSTQPLKRCGSCAGEKDPAGGVAMSASKWICSACWYKRVHRKR